MNDGSVKDVTKNYSTDTYGMGGTVKVINADAGDDFIFNKVQSRSKLTKFV